MKTYILETIVPPAPPSIFVSVIENLMSAFGFGSSSVSVGSLMSSSIVKLNEMTNVQSTSVSCSADKSIVKLNELSNIEVEGISCIIEKTITLQ